MSNSKKVMLIGWDAADWKVIHKLMDEGRMPTLERLVKNGVMGNMATLFPSLSPMLWTTIATGKRPYKHGIYGFSEPSPGGKSIQPMTNISRKCKAIWNILNQHDKKSIVVSWWPSNPAEPINGVMVSDFFHKAPRRPGDPWTVPKNCVHPGPVLKELAPLRVHPSALKPEHVLPFVPQAAEIDQENDGRLSTVMKMLSECVTTHRAASYLLQTRQWDFAAIYYDAIDHFCHGFMRYHPPQQEHISDEEFRIYSNVVTAAYVYHDTILAKLLETAGEEEVTVIVMSDHGFHPDHLRLKGIPTEPAGPAFEHRDYGIFVASGPGIKQDHIIHGASLADITPTILSLFGLPIADDMDGRPLLDIFEQEPEIETIASWEDVDGNDGQHPKGKVLEPSDSKEALEQLIALGYINRPDADATVAISNCQRELDYNLARAYMDGGLHGQAIPLLVNLYNKFPLEFRFGLQLSNCLRAMDRNDELETLVNDLNQRWRVASKEATKKLSEIAKMARERKNHWLELKEIDEDNQKDDTNAARLARVDAHGKPILFNESEKADIRKIRAVAKGNPQTLDFLAAAIASSKGDFDGALELLEKAEMSKSRDPGFHYQLGNVYLGLERHEDGERAYGKALEIDQYHPNSLMGLCRTYLELGRPKKARDFGTQAIGLKYHFPLAHFYLGNAKLQIGDTAGAITAYQTALDQNPNFVEAHKKLAKVYATSQSDATLAKEHEFAARELNSGQEEYLASTEKIDLKPADDLDFEEIIPDIGSQNDSEFVRCLAQPKPVDGKLESDAQEQQTCVIVTGLPRSGTSMMMQMLLAGGLEALSDGNRKPDESNPKGYYESDKVKKLAQVNNWLGECQGKVVKVVAPLIPYLPQGFNYHVVMMIREIEEILNSQEKMLERLNRPGGNLTNERFGNVFDQQLKTCRSLFRLHTIPYTEIPYSQAVSEPAVLAARINEFLPFDLDIAKMSHAVDPSLHRQKKAVT